MGNTASAAPLVITKTEKNPGGTQIEVFDGFRMALAANRAQFYLDVASGRGRIGVFPLDLPESLYDSADSDQQA